MRPATPSERSLHARAEEARGRAYAPYSEFEVGAAIEMEDGSVVTAGNVENGSYGLTICAEQAAVATAVARGLRTVVAVAVAGPGPNVAPCGACRQVLAEFGGPETPVTFPFGGDLQTATLAELLPARFAL